MGVRVEFFLHSNFSWGDVNILLSGVGRLLVLLILLLLTVLWLLVVGDLSLGYLWLSILFTKNMIRASLNLLNIINHILELVAP
jgi:hypothetical protein